jgi:hypothetical protein
MLATQETDIRRIVVQGQPRQKVLETPYQPKAGCGCNACHPSYIATHPSYKAQIRRWSRPAQAKSKTPFSKISNTKRAGGVTQVVECACLAIIRSCSLK